ncbi:aldehyde dehydrogenase family protein [Variovorax paradoxus]|nr:aldehyde dehydrogenase family protein [Variovorax paradoxus]MBT2305109.1 aldehyde dehydrogenase family protein [Variovorax paradoxus]
MKIHCNYIDGEWISATSGVANINPSNTDETVGWFAHGDARLAQDAVSAAGHARAAWAATGPLQRARLLEAVAAGIAARAAEFANTLSREEGKTLPEAQGETQRAEDIFRYYAGEVLRQAGELHDSIRPGVTVEVTREPIGVALLITPWNLPLAIPAWKTAAALAFGNCVILKPSEVAPACAWLLADVIHAAGFPPGVFNLVMGTGAELGPALLDNTIVSGVSFTGSVPTGRRIADASIATYKKLQLEMGGKNALVVLDDAELNIAVECALDGAFFATGQRCTASSRLVVTRGIYDRFVEEMLRRMSQVRIGHALNPETQIGPVVSQDQLERDLGYIALAKQEGGDLTGGELLERPHPGHYLSPCLVTGLRNDARVCREEIFGPVACVIKVSDYEEALAIANDTQFGLSSGICTTSLKHASHFRRHSQAGLAMVNMSTSGVDFHVPFGGRKASSHGSREQGRHAVEFFTAMKTSYIRA